MKSGKKTSTVIIKWTAGILLLAALICFISFRIGWDTLLSPWQKLKSLEILAAVVLVILSYLIRALRIAYFLAVGKDFRLMFKLVLQHNFFNNFLPMRSGELSFPILIRKYFNLKAVRSVPALIWLRMFDLQILFLIAVLSLAFQYLPAAAVVAIAAAVFCLPYLIWVLDRGLKRILQRRRSRAARFFKQALSVSPAGIGKITLTMMITTLNWLLKLTVFCWLLHALEQISFQNGILGSILGELSSVLPIHGIAGAGTYEGGVVAGLAARGIEFETAARAAVNLHLFILGLSLSGFLLSFLIPGNRKRS